jgi:uncharacterized protein (TIGR03643 family)
MPTHYPAFIRSPREPILLLPSHSLTKMQLIKAMPKQEPVVSDSAVISEIIEMALSDHVSFDAIRQLHGLSPDSVKVLMRRELKPVSYRAWRKRIDRFGARRLHYK